MSDLTVSLRIRANADGSVSVINGVGNSINALGNNANHSTQQLNEMQSSVSLLSERLGRMGHYATLAFGGSWIGSKAAEVVMLADKMTLLDSRIKIATSSTADYHAVNKALVDVSLKTGSALESNVQLFSRMNKAIEGMGGTAADTVGLTKTLAEGLKLSGATAGESSSLMIQLSQALSSGVLRGDEFNSVMENGSRVVDALSTATGKSRGELRKMAEAGELSSQMVVSALQSQSKAIDDDFKKIPLTVGAAMENVSTHFAVYIKEQNEARGATSLLAGAIDSAGKNITGIIDGVTLAAQGLFAVYMTKLIPSSLAYIGSQYTAITVSNTHAAALTFDLERTVVLTTARATQARVDLAAAEAMLINVRATTSGFAGMTARLAATQAVTAATTANTAATGAMSAAQLANAAATTSFIGSLRGLLTVQGAVNAAMGIFVGWQVGTFIGDWANSFGFVRYAAIETFASMERGINNVSLAYKTVKNLFSGSAEDLKAIQAAFAAEESAIVARVAGSQDYIKNGNQPKAAAEDPTLKDFYAKQKQMDVEAGAEKADTAKKVLDTRKETMDAAVSYVQSTANQEAAIVDNQINQLDRLYKNGQVSVKEYFEQSAALITRQSGIAIKAVNAQLAIVEREIGALSTSAPTVTIKANTAGLTAEIGAAITAAAAKYKIDPNLIKGLISHESGFNPNAMPPIDKETGKRASSAKGLMQLVDGTSAAMGYSPKDMFDVAKNIDAGTKYLAQQLATAGGDVKKALAAYYAGWGNINKNNAVAHTGLNNYAPDIMRRADQFAGGAKIPAVSSVAEKDSLDTTKRQNDLYKEQQKLKGELLVLGFKESQALAGNEDKLLDIGRTYEKAAMDANDVFDQNVKRLNQERDALAGTKSPMTTAAYSSAIIAETKALYDAIDATQSEQAALSAQKETQKLVSEARISAMSDIDKLIDKQNILNAAYASSTSPTDKATLKAGIDTGEKSILDARTKAADDYTKKLDDIIGKTKDLGATNSAVFDGALGGINLLVGSFSAMNDAIQANVKSQAELNKAIRENENTKPPTPMIKEYGDYVGRTNQLIDTQRKLDNKKVDDAISGTRRMAASSAKMFNEKSTAYKALSALEQGLGAAQMAMEAVRTAESIANAFKIITAKTAEGTASAGAAVANQGAGDPYTAFARIAAMVALMASIGFSVAGGGASEPSLSEQRQASAGTGTVLGDSTAKSESINKSIDILEKNSTISLPVYHKMLDALIAIKDSFTGLSNQITREFDVKGTAINPGAIYSKTLNSMLGDFKYVGGLVSSFIGQKVKMEDYGYSFKPNQSLGGLMDGKELGVSFYNDLKKSTTIFGMTISSSMKRVTEEASDPIKKQFTDVFLSQVEVMQALGEAFGLDAAKTNASLRDSKITIPDISLKDLKPEEMATMINNIFSASLDKIAGVVLGGIDIKQYQNAGEGLLETAVRVATGLMSLNENVDRLGISSAFTATGVNGMIAFSQELIHFSGGLDKLSDRFNNFFDRFYSDAEKSIYGAKSLTNNVAALGLAVPVTRQGWRDMVNGELALGETRAKEATKLLALSPAAADWFDAVESYRDTFTSSADKATNATNSLNAAVALTGQAMPATRQGWLDMTNAQLAMGESGHAGAVAILNARDAADNYYATLETAEAKRLSDAQAAIDKANSEAATAATKANADAVTAAAALLKSQQDVTEQLRALGSNDIQNGLAGIANKIKAIVDEAAKNGGTVSNVGALQTGLTDQYRKTLTDPIDKAFSDLNSTGSSAAITEFNANTKTIADGLQTGLFTAVQGADLSAKTSAIFADKLKAVFQSVNDTFDNIGLSATAISVKALRASRLTNDNAAIAALVAASPGGNISNASDANNSAFNTQMQHNAAVFNDGVSTLRKSITDTWDAVALIGLTPLQATFAGIIASLNDANKQADDFKAAMPATAENMALYNQQIENNTAKAFDDAKKAVQPLVDEFNAIGKTDLQTKLVAINQHLLDTVKSADKIAVALNDGTTAAQVTAGALAVSKSATDALFKDLIVEFESIGKTDLQKSADAIKKWFDDTILNTDAFLASNPGSTKSGYTAGAQALEADKYKALFKPLADEFNALGKIDFTKNVDGINTWYADTIKSTREIAAAYKVTDLSALQMINAIRDARLDALKKELDASIKTINTNYARLNVTGLEADLNSMSDSFIQSITELVAKGVTLDQATAVANVGLATGMNAYNKAVQDTQITFDAVFKAIKDKAVTLSDSIAGLSDKKNAATIQSAKDALSAQGMTAAQQAAAYANLNNLTATLSVNSVDALQKTRAYAVLHSDYINDSTKSAAQNDAAASQHYSDQMSAVDTLQSLIMKNYDDQVTAIGKVKDAAIGIDKYLNDLKLNEKLSLNSTKAIVDISAAQWATQLAMAKAGDVDAKAGLTTFADKYLNSARDYNGVSADYVAIRDQVTGALGQFGTAALDTPAQQAANAMASNTAQAVQELSALQVSLDSITQTQTQTLSAKLDLLRTTTYNVGVEFKTALYSLGATNGISQSTVNSSLSATSGPVPTFGHSTSAVATVPTSIVTAPPAVAAVDPVAQFGTYIASGDFVSAARLGWSLGYSDYQLADYADALLGIGADGRDNTLRYLASIPAYVDGGDYAGGLALVGERGPELINFNQPGQVYTAPQTRSILGGSGGGDTKEVVQAVDKNSEKIAKAINEAIQRAIAANAQGQQDMADELAAMREELERLRRSTEKLELSR